MNNRFQIEKFTRLYNINKSQKIFPRINGFFNTGRNSIVSSEAEVRCWRGPKIVNVGKYCSLGRCYFIIDGNHNPSFATTFPFRELCINHSAPWNDLSKDIPVVKNDVWICDDAYIHAGVVINNGSIIAANSVVTKDVPSYAIVAGNPAKVVKYRFDDNIIARFNNIEWWDLPEDFIVSTLAPCIDDVEKFLLLAETYKSKL